MKVNVLIFTDHASKAFSRTAGAYRIASELRSHGYTVQVVEHFLLSGLERTLEVIDKFVGEETLFVGFSTTFMNVSNVLLSESHNYAKRYKIHGYTKLNYATGPKASAKGVPIPPDDLKIIRDRIKTINPKIKLVVGGTKADYQLQEEIDTFILGYSDTAVVEYAKYLEGKNPFFQFKNLGNGRISVEHDPDASNFDFQNSKINYHESDLITKEEVLPIEVARGCIFRCKFCAFRLIGKKKFDYLKNSDILYTELIKNYEMFGTTKYIFSDDTYNDSLTKLELFAEVFQKLPFKIEYAAYLRHDLIYAHKDMADLLKESGLKSAIFGIETLHHPAGKIIGKGLSPENTKELLTWLREEKGWKNNVLMSSGFIVGLPTENYDTVSKWAEELIDFKYPLDSFVFTPLDIFPNAVRLGKSEFELNYEKYGYRFDPSISKGWINDQWRWEDAVILANELMNYSYASGRVKSNGFYAMMMHNIGYTWDNIHNRPGVQNEYGLLQKRLDMVDDYYRRLLK